MAPPDELADAVRIRIVDGPHAGYVLDVDPGPDGSAPEALVLCEPQLRPDTGSMHGRMRTYLLCTDMLDDGPDQAPHCYRVDARDGNGLSTATVDR